MFTRDRGFDMTASRSAGPHVLICGGGVAGIETLLALRALAGHRVEITMLSPEDEFLYRPVTVAEAFGRGEARAYELAGLVEHGGSGRVIRDRLAKVEPDAHVAVTAGGARIEYDALVVASGAIPREPLPGALTFRGRGDVTALAVLLDDLVSGAAQSVAFVLPSERMWSLPIYELALMTAAHLHEHGAREREVWLVTPEEEPLELFGPAAARAIEPMLAVQGIRIRTSSRAALVRGDALLLAGAGELHVDRVVTLPELEGPALLGLPRDAHGFIPVDSHGRVRSTEDVYAAGDVTAFPLKQGGLAAQQADAAASQIAADLGITTTSKPFSPVLRGLLLTGGAPLYLRAEPYRLPRGAAVVIDAETAPPDTREASAAAGQALWWPPSKIAGHYLGAFLATARPQPLQSALLTDRVAVSDRSLPRAEYQDPLQLALLLADCDARWGDYRSALNALEAAEALEAPLPREYQIKRREWRAAQVAG